MASSREYLEFILGQISELEEITYRAMMGEFIIYYRGKIVGGIYDDRLLAVSYTHLDVYKRQGQRSVLYGNGACRRDHSERLYKEKGKTFGKRDDQYFQDVYKRQGSCGKYSKEGDYLYAGAETCDYAFL